MKKGEIRDWRDISAEASRERDSQKLMKLIDELNHALQVYEEEGFAAQRRSRLV
jgi:hypothetical protein